MARRAKKIPSKWIEQTREFFRGFLYETDFPDADRTGERGPKSQYPEWRIARSVRRLYDIRFREGCSPIAIAK